MVVIEWFRCTGGETSDFNKYWRDAIFRSLLKQELWFETPLRTVPCSFSYGQISYGSTQAGSEASCCYSTIPADKFQVSDNG